LKINSKTLSDFIKKVTINGNISDGILKFGPDGLTLTVKDVTNAGAVTGILKATNFIDYSQMNIPIKNMTTLISVLNNMNGNVELSKRDNVFILSSEGNEGKLIMPDEAYLECDLPELPTLGHDGGFELDSRIWAAVKKNTQILGTGKVGVIAEVKDNILYITTGEDNFNQLTAKTAVDYKNVVARFGSTFLEFITVMSGKLNVAFNDNYPILITSRDPDSTIKWMISPIIDTEAESEEE